MVEQYYFSQGQTPSGPFSATEMRDLASGGRIHGTDLVWRSGTEQKVQASRVKNLFAALTPPAPAAPPASAPPERQIPPATSGVTSAVQTDDGPQAKPAPPARQKRVVAIKGGILMGQDGGKVQFRKKCGTCGHEDSVRSTATIRIGTCRVVFFCPKCRRSREVEFTAVG